ncbi:MAG TPA: glycosyltransferase family 4 protein [Anaerolineae bacterium]|nr:glycosyltransferase family 4 protein [Anaerolineae bacterium]
MKCVLVGPTYPFRGGIAHYTTLLCQQLAGRHRVHLLTFRRQYPAWLFPGHTDRDPSKQALTVAAEPLIDPLFPWTWLRAARRIRALAPDVLVLQWWHPFWSPTLWTIARYARRWANPRVLFICHNVLPHEAAWSGGRLARRVLGQGDAFVVHSERDRQDLIRLLPGAAVRRAVLPTYEKLAGRGPSPAESRAMLGLKEKARVLLYFGFVRQYKGLNYLIDALPRVLAEMEVHLVVAGEFWDDPAPYVQQIERLGLRERVTIVNRYVPDEELGPYLAAADLMVLPYVDATQSAVVPLAFGHGLPVLTTRVGGLPEVVEDGLTGLLVPPCDGQELANGILDFFRRDLGPGMRANIEAGRARFSWERMEAIIEELSRR